MTEKPVKFIVHMPFAVAYIAFPLAAMLGAPSSVFRVACISTLLMLAFSVDVTLFINAVCPELLGRRRKA